MTKSATVLSIAGSDSSGGAGIQADIKTCCAFGVYASTAITAITAQNTNGVQRVEAMDPDLVKAQIKSVLDDIGTDVIKIGMLANGDIAKTVADIIQEDTGAGWNVIDPVLVATSGDTLFDKDALDIFRTRLVPLADVLTPNIPEAEILSGIKIDTIEDMVKAGEVLRDMGAYSVLLKGGHLDG
ncbi:MAG TPA: bifunctional hydroxymethylpyrimidine kinase/phosphomethylpyrimidine kinase, partial [Hellea balneolensis]|nr:bifunctional hydroxymethylpyrimidine kinase/phosphomethylpyrimidine kinase [Hellea balneolensis]